MHVELKEINDKYINMNKSIKSGDIIVTEHGHYLFSVNNGLNLMIDLDRPNIIVTINEKTIKEIVNAYFYEELQKGTIRFINGYSAFITIEAKMSDIKVIRKEDC